MKISHIALAALLTLGAPAAAYAQATPAAPAAPEQEDNSAVGQFNNFDMFVDEFGAADFTNATTTLQAGSNFNIVRLSTAAGADAGRMNTALDARSADLTAFRAQIGSSADAVAALEAEGLTADSVVWIDAGADGRTNIYVSDF